MTDFEKWLQGSSALLEARVLQNPYIPQTPTPKQAMFLTAAFLESLFGGAAGPGKSSALLMAALMFVEVPGYAALLLRRTYADLSKPGALMSRAWQWLGETDAKWNEQKKMWSFPSGASLSFGYMEHDNDVYNYQSSEYQFIGLDELTQFSEFQYRYMFSRMRRLRDAPVPIRMRSATNPGGPGHEWVKRRFLLEGAQAGRLFVPARLDENPYLDKEEYEQSLQELPPHVRQQLQHGDWDALPPGEIFQRSWFKPIAVLPRGCRFVRYWDKAGTEGGKGARTAGVLVARTPDRRFCIADVVKGRYNAHERERVILQTAHADRARWENQQGGELSIWVEQEPGSGGKESADNTIRNLAGFSIRAERVTGDKVTRAQPLAAQAEAGNVDMLEGAWNGEFLDEIEAFPGALKDQVDGASGAFNKLAALPEEEEETYSTSGRGMTSARSTQHHNIRLRR